MTDFEKAMMVKFGWTNSKHILENPDEYSEAVHACVFYANAAWQACASQYEERLKVAEDALEYFVNSSGAEPSLSVAYTKAVEALKKNTR